MQSLYRSRSTHSGIIGQLEKDLKQLPDLVDDYDWPLMNSVFNIMNVNCTVIRSLVKTTTKAVFGVEYYGSLCSFCAKAKDMKL
jgi:hypothetical protein